MPTEWMPVKPYSDIRYEKCSLGIAKITINRPEKRNAFRPETVAQLFEAFSDAREDQRVGVVLLTGAGPHTDGKYAFCAGGDQSVRGPAGYVGGDGVPRLNVLDLQKLIRSMPKVVYRAGRRLRDWRRACAPPRVRLDDCGGQRGFRPGRPQDGQLRWWLRRELLGANRRAKEGA